MVVRLDINERRLEKYIGILQVKMLISSLLVLFFSISSAGAATLDFSSLGSDRLGSNSVDLPEATIKGIEWAPDPLIPSLNVTPDGFLCTTWVGAGCFDLDVNIQFKAPVSNLKFEGRVGYPGDGPPSMIWATVFDSSFSFLGKLEFEFFNDDHHLFDFSGINDISFLHVWQGSDDQDPAIGNFSFDQASFALAENDLSPVPLPAAAWLFGSAALCFAGIARRRKAA